ncbi:hypothetical protein A9G11_09570 [Gilliamella sp. wkB108]|uniref:ArsR/SmtB family transcription factor n=1 Tax=Gilliamella sp. wkB108 TaxID=3120256 RepID=UPI00080D93FA|nr:winged helix-turn-helix domain-containing protein [Gilliamella apicola]OCG20933.1 hypothetical protein A9G11_09570 [Gilliamella apicola]
MSKKIYCEDLIHFSDVMSDANRVMIISELMNGRSLCASWLAKQLNLSPSATRFHLKKLEDAQLIHQRTCGKHHYYEIKNQDTADFIESTFRIIPPKDYLYLTNNNSKQKFQQARTCYKHLAGSCSVAFTQSLLQNNIITIQEDLFLITEQGKDFFIQQQLLPESFNSNIVGKRCIDFTEHRDHIGGQLGSLLLETMLQQAWFKQDINRRELTITRLGLTKLHAINNSPFEIHETLS